MVRFLKSDPIGVFDSGVGGLTILSELQKLLPYENFVYVADQAFAPYGKRSIKELNTRTKDICEFLVSKQVKLIVVACNTASTSSIKHLRKQFSLPLVGVVPVIKTLAKVTKTKKTAVLATPVTAKSIYLDLLISEFGKGITVYKEGDTGLETIIETGNLSDSHIVPILKKHLASLKKLNVDAVALGCTHYPFVKDQMQKIAGPDILILDSGGAVARQTKRILEKENMLSDAKSGQDWYYTTGVAFKFDEVVKNLTGKKIHSNYKRI